MRVCSKVSTDATRSSGGILDPGTAASDIGKSTFPAAVFSKNDKVYQHLTATDAVSLKDNGKRQQDAQDGLHFLFDL